MPVDKSQFVITPGQGPRVHRKEGGRVVDVPVRAMKQEEELDTLMVGLTREDVSSAGSRLSGFGRHVASAGSGDIDARPRRSSGASDGDYGNTGGGDAPTDQGEAFSEDVGASDLLAQPATPGNRREYLDPAEAPVQERRDQPDARDQEDIWNKDVLEIFDEYNDEEPRDVPTFTGRPHRQQEAALQSGVKVGDTFRSRGF